MVKLKKKLNLKVQTDIVNEENSQIGTDYTRKFTSISDMDNEIDTLIEEYKSGIKTYSVEEARALLNAKLNKR